MSDVLVKPGDIPLELRRHGPITGKGSVLLIHGASANSDTFAVPNGGLIRYLQDRDWDVWTLDWRGSSRVVAKVLQQPPQPSWEGEYRRFTLDQVASEDIPWAIETIDREIAGRSLAVVAHCFGSGAFSIALARGFADRVSNVVLSTLGLFYEAPWDGWIKAEDFILERVLGNDPQCRAIDPQHPEKWPQDMQLAYKVLPERWMPPGGSQANEILKRLTFMFGQPYPAEVLAPGIHGPKLRDLFGAMHIGLYLHAGQMVRRGYAATFDAPDIVDRAHLATSKSSHPVSGARSSGEQGLVPGHCLLPKCFADKRVTLITGAQNRLWHRDSIDLMHEWLLAEVRPTGWGRRPRKHMLSAFAHQDLLWGQGSQQVYELIEQGLAS